LLIDCADVTGHNDRMSQTVTSAALSAANRRRSRTSRGLFALAALGCLLLVAAALTLAIPLVWSYRQWQAYLEQERIEAVVASGQLAPQGTKGSLLDPWGTQYRPEILVRYKPPEASEEIELWIEVAPDLPTMDVWEAEQRLEEFKPGERVVLVHDAENPTELRLDPGNRSWRTAVLGGVVSIFVAMPGIGLILTAWLLSRLGRKSATGSGVDCDNAVA
jgi:hypothetical protein